ncbi:hypothetical protein [Clostridium weizhouense]|uniref:Uncharacterized protein n=1 Tax=Clostridium weizhouense TaxID=2859781 RepID=A0ABS7AQL4_9CLOT|nr:hypothetical protein [Clostridium weizhouense]MBW6410965.1 hypothetical protein [Clostridium weizhouense]
MLKEIKDKFPAWCEDTETKYQLIMSDDIDAFMCYQMQKLNYGRECEYFINSSKDRAYKGYYGEKTGKQYFYNTDNATNKTKNTIALDFSINKNVKAWDNHVVHIGNHETNYNTLSANMNLVNNINKNNYTQKFCISTFITMLSYYEVKIQNWTHDELIALCGIDGLYQPFKNSKFIEQGKKNLHLLGFDFLSDFIQENLKEIEQFDQKYYKNKSIWVNKDGYLETNLDLDKLSDIWGFNMELPKQQFNLKRTLESRIFDTSYSKEQLENKYNKKIFNIALTYRSSGVVSFIG